MKGLEALNEIEKFIENNLSKTKDNESFNLGFDIGIIEKELKRLEEYDNTEYSALIESHKKLLKEKKVNKKKLKALEIIKNTGILSPYETIDGQCWLETMCGNIKLTKDNYDLLKEIL